MPENSTLQSPCRSICTGCCFYCLPFMMFSHLLCLLIPGASSLTVHLTWYLKLLCRNHLNSRVIFSSYKRNASSDSSSLSSIAISDISQFNMIQSWSVVSANCCLPLALPDYWSMHFRIPTEREVFYLDFHIQLLYFNSCSLTSSSFQRCHLAFQLHQQRQKWSQMTGSYLSISLFP